MADSMYTDGGDYAKHDCSAGSDIGYVLQRGRELSRLGMHVRTVTLGMNTLPFGCAQGSLTGALRNEIAAAAIGFSEAVDRASEKFGVPIISRRIAVSPISLYPCVRDAKAAVDVAKALDDGVAKANTQCSGESAIAFIGGYAAFCERGGSRASQYVIDSIPDAISTTRHVCCCVNGASTRAGMNLKAILEFASVLKELAQRSSDGAGCARVVISCNAPSGTPYMPAAFHGIEEADRVVNIGIGGASAIKDIIDQCGDASLDVVVGKIQRLMSDMTRVAECLGRDIAQRLGAEFGVVDLSIAPSLQPTVNSVGALIHSLGVSEFGTHGTTAAMAFLLNALKRGGNAGCTHSGGMSGAFLPISEDATLLSAVVGGGLTLDKLESLTSVCCVGMDMIGIPGDTSVVQIAGIIADELAIGMVNNKTTAVRVVPVPNSRPGDVVDLTGYNPLLGRVVVMPVKAGDARRLFERNGDRRIPAPYRALTN